MRPSTCGEVSRCDTSERWLRKRHISRLRCRSVLDHAAARAREDWPGTWQRVNNSQAPKRHKDCAFVSSSQRGTARHAGEGARSASKLACLRTLTSTESHAAAGPGVNMTPAYALASVRVRVRREPRAPCTQGGPSPLVLRNVGKRAAARRQHCTGGRVAPARATAQTMCLCDATESLRVRVAAPSTQHARRVRAGRKHLLPPLFRSRALSRPRPDAMSCFRGTCIVYGLATETGTLPVRVTSVHKVCAQRPGAPQRVQGGTHRTAWPARRRLYCWCPGVRLLSWTTGPSAEQGTRAGPPNLWPPVTPRLSTMRLACRQQGRFRTRFTALEAGRAASFSS